MALLKFFVFDLLDKKYEIKNVLSYELSKNADAACDGLRLKFSGGDFNSELNRVEVFYENEIIFFGFIDTQRETLSENEKTCFIYARSSACLLVDNDAYPATYYCPSARALYFSNAKDLGFEYGLGEIACDFEYRVEAGASCFGAINNFVYSQKGQNIIVTPKNVITLPERRKKVFDKSEKILSVTKLTNRADAVSQIDYKPESSFRYTHHLKSRTLEEKKIKRSKKLNVSSLPEWKKRNALKEKLEAFSRNYKTVEIILDGGYNYSLYDVLFLPDKEGEYVINSVTLTLDERGERTKLSLYKKLDLKEINYVAE